MSKASEWVTVEAALRLRLYEIERDRTILRPRFVPAATAPVPLAEVTADGRLQLHAEAKLEARDAEAFAHWIIATFGEAIAVSAAVRDAERVERSGR